MSISKDSIISLHNSDNFSDKIKKALDDVKEMSKINQILIGNYIIFILFLF